MAWLSFQASAQNLATDARKAFVDGYVQQAMQRGDSADAARADANCMFDELQARLTPAEWTELARAQRDGSSPAWFRRLAPEFVACAHLGRRSGRSSPSADSDSGRLPAPDDADSVRVARELRQLRVIEEARQRQTSGHPVILPTGRCTANITLDDTGQPQGYFPVSCSDPQLQADMRHAVMAALPLQAVGPATVELRVTANDAQPIDAVGSPRRTVDPQTDIDRRYTALVRQELQMMRQQQVMQQLRAHLSPPRPLIGTCSATVQLNSIGTDSLPLSPVVTCSDPRLETSMHRAILAARALTAQSGSTTVQLRINGFFPSP
jgi:hypothetical protein